MTERVWQWDLKDARAALYLAIAIALVASLLSHGCGAMQLRQEVEGGVSALSTVVDTTYELAVDGCVAAEKAEVAAEKGGQPSAATDKNLVIIRARCDVIRTRFDQIVEMLKAADTALRAGETATARKQLEEAKRQWRLSHSP